MRDLGGDKKCARRPKGHCGKLHTPCMTSTWKVLLLKGKRREKRKKEGEKEKDRKREREREKRKAEVHTAL